MAFTSQYRLGPVQTPRALKLFLLFNLVVSLGSALFDQLLTRMNWFSPQALLSLSARAVDNGAFWQLISYLFIHPIAHGISLSFLITLAFTLYLLWIIGTAVIERRGVLAFFLVYLLSGLFSGFAMYCVMGPMTPPYAGNAGALFALLLAWTMLYPEAQLMLLLALPMKAKWLLTAIFSINLLIDVSIGEWVSVVANISALVFAYFFGLLAWGREGPFRALHAFEHRVIGVTRIRGRTPPSASANAKIYDFKTGEAILGDEEFLEAMLSKISVYGRGSLSWKERWRLRRISKRKRKG